MALQFRTTVPAGVPGDIWAREIGRLLENAANDILTGVPPERYLAAVARYQALAELMNYADDYITREQKGESVD